MFTMAQLKPFRAGIRGKSYGSTLAWFPGTNPGSGERPVTVNLDLNLQKFYGQFAAVLASPSRELH
jgi:hypothetical protein